MSWNFLIAAGQGHMSAYMRNANIESSNAIATANADGRNRVRNASNAFTAARGALARYMQSLRNNQTLAAGGEALESNLVNARRVDDAMLQQGFEQAIQHSEQTGAQAAAAAFAGVDGEVADIVSASTRLMQRRSEYAALKSRDFTNYDAARRGASIVQQTIRSLDDSLIFDSLDTGRDVPWLRAKVNPTKLSLLAAGAAWGGEQNAEYGKDPGVTERANTNYSNEGRNYRSKSQSFEWGTGNDYGNQDFGGFL